MIVGHYSPLPLECIGPFTHSITRNYFFYLIEIVHFRTRVKLIPLNIILQVLLAFCSSLYHKVQTKKES